MSVLVTIRAGPGASNVTAARIVSRKERVWGACSLLPPKDYGVWLLPKKKKEKERISTYIYL